MTLAERLATFTAGLAADDVPPAVVENVQLRVLDTLGIALASSTQDFAASVLGALDAWGTSESAALALDGLDEVGALLRLCRI